MGVSKEQGLLAESEIKSLLTRERYYRDTGQWTRLRESWHPDSSLTLLKVSWFTGNLVAFIEGSKKMAQSGTVASHSITPVDIHFSTSRKKVVSESTGNITIRFKLDNDARHELVSWARFVSKLEKAGDDWKLVSLKTTVSVAHWAAYHSSSNFHRPEEFCPERWLDDPEFADDHKDVLQPFQIGPRNCIGQNLAYAEMRLVLARVLWNFDLELQGEIVAWKRPPIYGFWEKEPLFVKINPYEGATGSRK